VSGHGTWPAARVERDMATLEKGVEQYSSDVITQLKRAGAMPDMVQVGSLSRTDALKHCDIS